MNKPSIVITSGDEVAGRAWLEFRVEPKRSCAVECSCVLLYEGLRWSAILECLSFSPFHFWGSDSESKNEEKKPMMRLTCLRFVRSANDLFRQAFIISGGRICMDT